MKTIIRLNRHRFLKCSVILLAVLFPLTLALAEAADCGPDRDQCPMTICCIPFLLSDHIIVHALQVVPYCPSMTVVAPGLILLAIFHPPRA